MANVKSLNNSASVSMQPEVVKNRFSQALYTLVSKVTQAVGKMFAFIASIPARVGSFLASALHLRKAEKVVADSQENIEAVAVMVSADNDISAADLDGIDFEDGDVQPRLNKKAVAGAVAAGVALLGAGACYYYGVNPMAVAGDACAAAGARLKAGLQSIGLIKTEQPYSGWKNTWGYTRQFI